MSPSELALEHFAGPPVDPFALALKRGLSIQPGSQPASADERIILNGHAFYPRLRFQAAHELVESLWRPDSEREAQELASLLLMPTEWMTADLEAFGPDLELLTARYQVSYEACAHRLCQLGDFIIALVDNGKLTRRLCSEGFTAPASLTPKEARLVEGCLADWAKKQEGLTTAWPARPVCNSIRRVVVVTEADQL